MVAAEDTGAADAQQIAPLALHGVEQQRTEPDALGLRDPDALIVGDGDDLRSFAGERVVEPIILAYMVVSLPVRCQRSARGSSREAPGSPDGLAQGGLWRVGSTGVGFDLQYIHSDIRRPPLRTFT